ncbi:MAG: hypothetical protein BAJALOKI3v1_90048 [Promethearchaeota archaeon]|jgi:hypothetical protein|nr:MAG: hypothetical protein BAJALOKI3v1_90048 [Candidatus Lokiarchaeota archaeon]
MELQRAIEILEDHLNKFGSNINSDQVSFIRDKLELYKREIKIRKDFPVHLARYSKI